MHPLSEILEEMGLVNSPPKTMQEVRLLVAEAMCWAVGAQDAWPGLENTYLELADRFLQEKLARTKKASG